MFVHNLLLIILISFVNGIDYQVVDNSLAKIELSRNYVLTCNLTNHTDSIIVYWYKLDRTTNMSTIIDNNDSTKYIIINNFGFNSSLNILNIQLNDITRYFCIGENGEYDQKDLTKLKIDNTNQSCLIDQCDCSYIWLNSSFITLKYLTSMNCSYRYLTEIEKYLLDSTVYDSFELFNNVTFFNFNSNLITKIQTDLFTYFTNLEQLDLSSNKIQMIQDGSFSKLKYLKILNLNDNLIKSINKFTFYGLSQITQIKLTNNQLNSIGIDSFNFSLITNLDLSNNDIQLIDIPTLNRLTNLTKLDLSQNSIRKIVDYSFQSLNNLRNLDLSENKIEIISKNTFYGLNELEILSLNDNDIVEFDVNALSILEKAKISLENNPVKINTWILFCNRK